MKRRPWGRAGGGRRVGLSFFPLERPTIWPGVLPVTSDETLALAPLVLLEQNATELGQGVRAHIVERPEDALPVVDRQRDHSGLESERLLEEGACRLVDERYELADVLVRDAQAAEIHRGEVPSE